MLQDWWKLVQRMFGFVLCTLLLLLEDIVHWLQNAFAEFDLIIFQSFGCKTANYGHVKYSCHSSLGPVKLVYAVALMLKSSTFGSRLFSSIALLGASQLGLHNAHGMLSQNEDVLQEVEAGVARCVIRISSHDRELSHAPLCYLRHDISCDDACNNGAAHLLCRLAPYAHSRACMLQLLEELAEQPWIAGPGPL
eukprot:5151451-Amphidinium_carterae.1